MAGIQADKRDWISVTSLESDCGGTRRTPTGGKGVAVGVGVSVGDGVLVGEGVGVSEGETPGIPP